jgi:phosphatidate cytidylyltransferase
LTAASGTAARRAAAFVPIEQAPAPSSGAPGKGRGRAGRDVPVAIGVGVVLAALAVVPLVAYKPAFVLVAALAVSVGSWELVSALRVLGLRPPLLPLIAGSVAMAAAGYLRGAGALLLALVATVAVTTVWRRAGPREGAYRDTTAGALAAAYVPFLAGFALLLAAPPDGDRRVLTFLLVTVASDVGGFAFGVLLGRHRMAPRISPGKTWEGLAGSAAASVAAGVAAMTLLLPGSVWQGAALGLVVAATATLGDLGQSLIKRRTGIKDMGTLLPGHGGIMDRLDSLLPTAPVVWLLLSAFIPLH